MSTEHTTPGMEGYRRIHRLTPLLRVWAFVLALATIALFNFTMPIYHWAQRAVAELARHRADARVGPRVVRCPGGTTLRRSNRVVG